MPKLWSDDEVQDTLKILGQFTYPEYPEALALIRSTTGRTISSSSLTKLFAKRGLDSPTTYLRKVTHLANSCGPWTMEAVRILQKYSAQDAPQAIGEIRAALQIEVTPDSLWLAFKRFGVRNPLFYYRLGGLDSRRAFHKKAAVWFTLSNAELKEREASVQRSSKQHKPCRTCGATERFPRGNCVPCSNASQRKFYTENLAHARDRQLRRYYGISAADKEAMYSAQQRKCGFCKESLPDVWAKTCHVDHCHKTGKIRSLVHQRCNVIIGVLESEKYGSMMKEYLSK